MELTSQFHIFPDMLGPSERRRIDRSTCHSFSSEPVNIRAQNKIGFEVCMTQNHSHFCLSIVLAPAFVNFGHLSSGVHGDLKKNFLTLHLLHFLLRCSFEVTRILLSPYSTLFLGNASKLHGTLGKKVLYKYM